MREELVKEMEARGISMEADETPQEEVSQEQIETPKEETIEDKAMAMGWKPDHKGPGFVSAEEFVARGSFFRKIESQSKELRELRDVVKRLDDHNRKIADASYKRGVEDAISQRTSAIENGDIAAFNKAEAELKRLETIKPVEETPKSPEVSQDMRDWVEANKTWFNNTSAKNIRMVKEADGLFMLEKSDNPNLSDKEILEVVKDKIAALHPDVFVNPQREKPIAITKTSTVSQNSRATLSGRLTDQQLKLYEQAKSVGISLTAEEYAKQLDLIGELR